MNTGEAAVGPQQENDHDFGDRGKRKRRERSLEPSGKERRDAPRHVPIG